MASVTLGYGLFVAPLILASLLLLSVALIAYRSRFVPIWVASLSVPAGIALLLGVFFIPIFVLLLWVLIVSVVMLVRGLAAGRDPQSRRPPSPRR